MTKSTYLLTSAVCTFLLTTGCGGGGSKNVDANSNVNTNSETTTNSNLGGNSDTNTDPSNPVSDKTTLEFNLSGAKALITKEKMIESVSTKTSQQHTNAKTDLSSEQSLFTYKITDKTSTGVRAKTDANANGSSNLVALDKDGNAKLAIDTDGQIKVLYTVAAPDGESVFIALDNGWYENDGNDYQQFIAERNCALYEVKTSDNSYRCVENGLYVQKIDDNYWQKISGDQKPIQFDDQQNMYFTASTFSVNTDNGTCNNFETDEATGEQRCVTETGSESSYLWINDVNWNPTIYKQDAVTKEVTAITQDNQSVDFFVVLGSGEIVVQSYDYTSGTAELNMIQGTQVIDLTTDNWGVDFFTVDSANTVLFGHADGNFSSKNGIRFARPRPNGGTDKASLNTSLFSSYNGSDWVDPKPRRVLTGGNGRVYGVFESGRSKLDLNNNWEWEKTLTVYQVLPHNASPKLEITLSNGQDWWYWMGETPFQISKNSIYYKENIDVDGYGTADVIKMKNLESGETIELLTPTNDTRYKIYNWKYSDDTLYFSALNEVTSVVVIGEVDTTKVGNGDNSDAVTINPSMSASGAVSAVQDIEIIGSEQSETDTGEAPEITEVHQDPDNLYSMSVDFSKRMDHNSLDLGLTLNSSAEEGPDANDKNRIPALKLWIDKTLHLIPDLDGLGNSNSTSMSPENTYTLSLAGNTVMDTYSRPLPASEHSITMHPAKGFYIRPLADDNVEETVSKDKVLKYAGNDERHLQTFDLGSVPDNVRLEFSAKISGWEGLQVIYYNTSNTNWDKSIARIKMGYWTDIRYLNSTLGSPSNDDDDTSEVNNGKWKRYRLDFFGNNIKISYSTDGSEFTEITSLSQTDLIPRNSSNKHHLYLRVRDLITFDNMQITTLNVSGEISGDTGDVLNESYDEESLNERYKKDITEDRGFNENW